MECLDTDTAQPRYVICAVARDGSDYVCTPFGHLAEGNPYYAYRPPDPNDPDAFLPRAEPGDKG
ncbi:hypothetical protein MesoLjLb_76200 [Mesorhizobium sp. L-8-3]|nr:hypothetical protein MesoLjLb_76200 [Mesorhizobium sp. L-8-3]